MTDSEDKNRDLREINNEIAQAMQHWKMTAAQKENEKLQLMRENNDLRHQISALRNAQLSWSRKLSAELQTASEELLTHLVKASGVVTKMLELTKSTMQDHMEPKLPRWSSIGSTPAADKVNRVPPTIVGGRHIQPVVSLSRTLQPNNSGSNNGRQPAWLVPMIRLQRVPIPLTRIEHERNLEANEEQDMEEDSTEDLPSDTSERLEESSSAREDFEESSRHLEPVPEEEELETGHDDSRVMENPLEGPSWLLDSSSLNTMRRYQNPRRSELNSTSEADVNGLSPGPSRRELQMEPVSVTVECEFTPTVRRRRRVAPHDPATPSPLRSPHRSPRRSPPPTRRLSNSSRVLKVMVTKMRLSDDEDDEDDSDDDMPPKKSKNIANRQPAKRPASDETGQTETPPKRPNLDETSPKPQKISKRRFPDTPKRGESSPTKRHSTDGSPIIHLNPSRRFILYDTPSPKGSTDARVIVLESRNDEPEPCCSGVARSRRLNQGSSCEIRNHNRSNHGNHNRLNHSNEDNRRRKNSHDTPTSQPSDNINSNINDGNHNNSNHDINLANRHTHSNEDNRRRKNSHDTPTSQPSDNSNSNSNDGNHNNSNHGINLANRHNNSNEDNRRRNNSRDTSTSQPSDNSNSNSNHDNHNNNNHDTNLTNRHNDNKKDNRRRKKGRDTPTSQLNDDSNGNHSNNSSRNDTTNMTASNHVNINLNSRPLDHSDGRNNNGIDSDSCGNSDIISEARTRRPRKAVIYKEKPLNRKLRR